MSSNIIALSFRFQHSLNDCIELLTSNEKLKMAEIIDSELSSKFLVICVIQFDCAIFKSHKLKSSSLFHWLSHFYFPFNEMHFSLFSCFIIIGFLYLRVILVKVYFEFSIGRFLVFVLVFHITHLIINSSRVSLNCFFQFFQVFIFCFVGKHQRLDTSDRALKRWK